MTLPTTNNIDQRDTCRLIPSKFGDSVLTRIADDDDHLQDIFALDDLTNNRLKAERGLLPGISPLELVYGFRHYRVINAAFCLASPLGGRFNSPERGAWYASFEEKGALTEVIFHKQLQLDEINYYHDDEEYTLYYADFNGSYHDIRNQKIFSPCLDPDSYIESQKLALTLLSNESAGVIYPSVRREATTNIVCFRPALVNNVRQGKNIFLEWNGSRKPRIAYNEPYLR